MALQGNATPNPLFEELISNLDITSILRKFSDRGLPPPPPQVKTTNIAFGNHYLIFVINQAWFIILDIYIYIDKSHTKNYWKIRICNLN